MGLGEKAEAAIYAACAVVSIVSFVVIIIRTFV